MTSGRTVLDNFLAYREHFGLVSPIEQISTLPDRVFFYDPAMELLDHALRASFAPGDGKNHGKSVVLSLRARRSPSLQLCVHRALHAPTGKIRLHFEMDFDLAPPLLDKPKFFLVHVGEVALNCLTGSTTDQDAVWRMLQTDWARTGGD